LVIEPDGRITFATSEAERLFGMTRERLSSAGIDDLVPEQPSVLSSSMDLSDNERVERQTSKKPHSLTEHSANLADERQPSAELLRGNGERGLFVDDEVVVCSSVTRLLERLGYRMTAAQPVGRERSVCAALRELLPPRRLDLERCSDQLDFMRGGRTADPWDVRAAEERLDFAHTARLQDCFSGSPRRARLGIFARPRGRQV
jgi:hypothetical protein